MTPQQKKAKELVEKFSTKEDALIACDEIIKEHCHESENKNPVAQDRWIEFWQSVKQEITKLI